MTISKYVKKIHVMQTGSSKLSSNESDRLEICPEAKIDHYIEHFYGPIMCKAKNDEKFRAILQLFIFPLQPLLILHHLKGNRMYFIFFQYTNTYFSGKKWSKKGVKPKILIFSFGFSKFFFQE